MDFAGHLFMAATGGREDAAECDAVEGDAARRRVKCGMNMGLSSAAEREVEREVRTGWVIRFSAGLGTVWVWA